MARRGARQVVAPTEPFRKPPVPGRRPRADEQPDAIEIVVEEPAPAASKPTATRSRGKGATRSGSGSLAREVAAELRREAGPRAADKLLGQLAAAASALEADRVGDALGLLRPVVKAAPGSPTVRELMGLTLYRHGRWADAATHLEAHKQMTGSAERLPVLADCYRALKRYAEVDRLWSELGEASPGAAVVAEGRIVAAGALADQGQLRRAIAMLEKAPGPRSKRPPEPHHLRTWYALADLYERTGDVPRARSLFGRVATHAPDLADTADRLAALG